jgi:RimJ/RimL family protein N-acetyltransferase
MHPAHHSSSSATAHSATSAISVRTTRALPHQHGHTRLRVMAHAPQCGGPSLHVLSDADRPAVLEHLLGLSADDRYLRFGQHVKTSHVSRYADSLVFEMERVFGIFREGRLIAMSQLASYQDANMAMAEIGLSVDTAYRGNGFGTLMVKTCLLEAKRQGFASVEINYVACNQAMAQLCQRLDASLVPDQDLVCATVHLRHPSKRQAPHFPSAAAKERLSAWLLARIGVFL